MPSNQRSSDAELRLSKEKGGDSLSEKGKFNRCLGREFIALVMEWWGNT